MPRASVVILVWNGRSFLPECLSAVLRQDHPDYEVIVVDNASTDGSAEFVAANYPQVRLVRNPINLGFARGMNVGLRTATGEVIALLNQDATVVPHWLTALDQALSGERDVAIAGCKVLYPDRVTVQHAGGIIHFPTALADHIGYRQPDRPEWNQPADVDYVTGAAFALRRDVVAATGGFDEGFYPAYYEETDLCWRARAVGFRIRYVPEALVYHYESSSVARESEQYYRYFHTGRLRFVFKHWTADQVREAFVPTEMERLQNGPGALEQQAVHFACLHTKQNLDEVIAYRQRAARLTDFQAAVERDALTRAVELLADGIATVLHPVSTSDPLAEHYRRMIDQAGIAEPTFHSHLPIAGRLIVAMRRAWNWMSTKWYVLPILQQQNAFNDATVRAVAELCERMGQAQIAQRTAALRLNAAEHAILDTHVRVIGLANANHDAQARLTALEERARCVEHSVLDTHTRTEQRLAQSLDRIAKLEAMVQGMEANAAAMDRDLTGLTRDLARLALRLRLATHPDEATAARRLLDISVDLAATDDPPAGDSKPEPAVGSPAPKVGG